MLRTIVTVVLTVVAVLFTINNFDHVPVHLVFGKELQIRLIFVIAIAGVAGFLIRHFIGVSREEELKRRLLRERKKQGSRKRLPDVDDILD
uniref:Magnetosome protein MamL n=1 Tax=bacterium FH-1 TaxID=1297054 RepID=M1QLL3_UNCXX|nr:magnetosome protein MamL [bacterium FH-1]